MKAISIRQPWASLIIAGGKDIENRSWPTAYRGPVLIHAGKGMTAAEFNAAMDFLDDTFPVDDHDAAKRVLEHEAAPRGGIVGTAEIVDCVTASRSPWFFGPYGFVLRNAAPLPFKPCRGQLGFFTPEHERTEPKTRPPKPPAMLDLFR